MPLGVLFWVLWVFGLILVGFWGWQPPNRLGAGAWLLFWLALGCCGWRLFGPVVSG